MYLVDEQDYLPLAVHHVLHDALQPFLELTLILRAGYERTHIQRVYGLVLEVFRNVAVHYLLGYAFGDRSLADSRLAHQYRIVLGPPAEDLKNPPYLVIPAYHGIQLPLGSKFVEIYSELRKKLEFIFSHMSFLLLTICRLLCLKHMDTTK